MALRLELNRNRIYMAGHRGVIEFRVTNTADAVLSVRLSLQSSPPGLLGESEGNRVHVPPGSSRRAMVPVLPTDAGEVLFNLSAACDVQRRTHVFVSAEAPPLIILPAAESPRHLAISIDNSINSSDGVSNRIGNDLTQLVREHADRGGSVVAMLSEHGPDQWHRIELLSEYDAAPLDLDDALGVAETPAIAEDELRRETWRVLATAATGSKAVLEQIIRKHAIRPDRADNIVREVRAQAEQEREVLRSECAAADVVAKDFEQLARRRIAEWERLGGLGWPDAAFLLARCCRCGIVDAKEGSDAATWFRRAAEGGHLEAMHELGWVLEKLDKEEAVRWLRKAAQRGHIMSIFFLLDREWCDLAEASMWMHAAANAGDTAAMLQLVGHYEKGVWVAQDFNAALRWLRRAADAGDSDAMSDLAQRLSEGRGVAANQVEATTWFRKAAEAEDVAAAYELAQRLADGRGSRVDPAEALLWFRRAAEHAYTTTKLDFAHRLREGRGVPQDDVEALYWYRKAAEEWPLADEAKALSSVFVGWAYECGRGVPTDLTAAADWYRRAAEQGNAQGMQRYAKCFELGNGVVKDVEQAFEWHMNAAAAGVHESAKRLAQLCWERETTWSEFTQVAQWCLAAPEPPWEELLPVADRLMEVLELNVADLELSIRSRKILQRLDVRTLWDLSRRTAAEVLACKNSGLTSLGEIKKTLADCGLSLRDQDELSDSLAVRCYAMAANAGRPDGLHRYALALDSGVGTKHDRSAALELMMRAASAGNEAAEEWLRDVRGRSERS